MLNSIPANKHTLEESGVLVLSELGKLRKLSCSVLNRLTEQERSTVLQHCKPMLAKRRSTIFRQGQKQIGIYLLLSGCIRVFFISPAGREITRAYWFTGNFIGGPNVFSKEPHMWSAKAVSDTSMLFLPSDTLRKLCETIPNLAIGLIEAMEFKGRCYSAMAQMLGTCSASDRMRQVLLHLACDYGVGTSQGIEINTNFTQEEIARMVGSSRQWVAAHLKRLESDGVIRSNRGRLLIYDLDALKSSYD